MIISFQIFLYPLSSAFISCLKLSTAGKNESQPKELKFGTHHIWSQHKIYIFQQKKLKLTNSYPVKLVLADLGKNSQLT